MSGTTVADEHLMSILARASQGDSAAYDQAFALTYAELKRVARGVRLALHGQTLNTTGIVHECYLRLIRSQPAAADLAHFLAIAARAMRHLIIEQARARTTAKRGGAARDEMLNDDIAIDHNAQELIELDDLLSRLAAHDPRCAQVVECRYFGGLSESETAKALHVALRTVQRDWIKARDWLAEHSR